VTRSPRERAPEAIAVLHLIAAIALPIAAYAQPTGQLVGSIYDQTGGALVGVAVTLQGATIQQGASDAAGRFEFRDLRAGDYTLSTAVEGFETVNRLIRINANETSSISLTMVLVAREQTVVTADKVGERTVQSSPLAISAVSGADLTHLAVRTVDQAAAFVPSVTFAQNSSFGQLSIRGIGTNTFQAGGDPSTAMYLDGVYLARPAMVFAHFLDLDRIEVLRGPQGTLYGRNAVGGALNVISKAPTNDFHVSARATAGNLGERRAEARMSGPLKRDRLMGSVAVARGARDGYVRDLDHPDHPLGGDDVTAARGQLRVILNRRSDVLVFADVSNQDGTLLTFNKILSVKPGFTVDNPSDLREVRTSTLAASGVRQSGMTARATLMLTPSTTIVSLTAYRQLDHEFLVDADITELDVLVVHVHEGQHQWSQELMASGRRQRLSWVAGLFVFDEFDRQRVWADVPQSRTQVRLDPRVNATSTALFGETKVELTSRLSGIVGLRYTREGKGIDNAGGVYGFDPPRAPVAGSVYGYTDSIRHTAWTPKFGIQRTLWGSVLTYLSATRGFKTGGFNLSSTRAGLGFGPEWAWSYEAGLKTNVRNDRTRVRVAAFHTDYSGLQVQTPIGIGAFDITNAASATIRGVEVEAESRIRRDLHAGGHLSWLDAVYDRYIAVSEARSTADVAGNRLNNAPEWSGRLWIEWNRSIGTSRRLSVTADATAQSTVFYTPFNDDIQRQRPYALLGGRAEWGPSHRRWAVNVYARNLTNTDYIMATFGTSPTAFGGRPGPSRQFGAQFVVQR
jgi:iron complex outermembrane receptor protein